jgi:tetratricopeptide (TPR) repeat protein
MGDSAAASDLLECVHLRSFITNPLATYGSTSCIIFLMGNRVLSESLNQQANALYDLKRYEKAILCYDQCLEKDPNYVRAYNGKGLL